MMNKGSIFCAVFALLVSISPAVGQETVFDLLKSDQKLADQYFTNKDYRSALALYQNIVRKHPSREIELKIARTYLLLKEYPKAVAAYEKQMTKNSLPVIDLYYYAEAQTGISNYEEASESFRDYLAKVPGDPLIMKKIWRLNNIEYLLEDSMHFAVRPLQINTADGELGAVPYHGGIVMLSNRKEIQPIEILDASHGPFYKVYFSAFSTDSLLQTRRYQTPGIFIKELSSKFHAGPLCFYNGERNMVFTTTAKRMKRDKEKTLQLYFAENRNGQWKVINDFPFNSKEYTISDPFVSEDGRVLYFSSNMTGGFGGRDLYKSELINNQWTKPVNLGESINTPYDEVFPFIHHHTLYFSSDGHPGLGGLDIFKAEQIEKGFMEPQNMGYPLNTNFDDFGITIDSSDTHGYFSSNRRSGGLNDDVYEFEMDLQTYPLEINGVMKFKEHNLNDSAEIKVMPNARIYLMDNVRNITVQETICDSKGNFSIVVPYYSQYKIRVVGEDNDENVVSLEIPRHRKLQSQHEIVIIKDVFR